MQSDEEILRGGCGRTSGQIESSAYTLGLMLIIVAVISICLLARHWLFISQ